jgi:hypothetical protein
MELPMEEPLSTHGIVFRPHPDRGKPGALCKVLRLPESPNVPKQLCNLTININKELFLSWLDDIAKFDMMMVRMG